MKWLLKQKIRKGNLNSIKHGYAVKQFSIYKRQLKRETQREKKLTTTIAIGLGDTTSINVGFICARKRVGVFGVFFN